MPKTMGVNGNIRFLSPIIYLQPQTLGIRPKILSFDCLSQKRFFKSTSNFLLIGITLSLEPFPPTTVNEPDPKLICLTSKLASSTTYQY